MSVSFFNKFLQLVIVWALIVALSGVGALTGALQQTMPAAAATIEQPFSWDNSTVYFVIVDRFMNGNSANDNSFGRKKVDSRGTNIGTFHGGDFKGLTLKLNDGYFTKLGVNAIWVTAPYEQIHGWVSGGSTGDFAHYAYHGYYPLDWTAMDPNYGTIEEFREFVDTAHINGIRVVVDVVMNHAGYGTLKDMATYGFGGADAMKNGNTYDPTDYGLSYIGMHGIIDYDSESAWSNWWNKWVRAGLPGYTPAPPLADDEINGQLAYLPDLRTDLKTSVGLPPILVNKWKKEMTGFEKWNLPKAAQLRKDQKIAPGDYLVKWISAWVEEFGIDGIRADTAKHVELSRWKQLADACDAALKTWRTNNPSKPGASWTDDFWMTAEVFGLGVGKTDYHTKGGFDSTINFKFQSEPSYMYQIDKTYQEYAQEINSDPNMNALSYISSHDTMLYDRDDLFNGGTALLLAPGGVQIFYGDETGRPTGKNGSDKDQGSRSSMNWASYNSSLLLHWQKLGTFRNEHLAIGAGTHQKLSDKPFVFSRSYNNNGVQDQVIVAIGASGWVTVDAKGVFAEGELVRDHYSGRFAKVTNGKLRLHSSTAGVMLLEKNVSSDTSNLLPAPKGAAVGLAANVANVTWNAVSGAKSYNIYLNSEKIASVQNATSYRIKTSTWKKGQTQQVEVTAVDDAGESMLSNLTKASIPKDVIQITGEQIRINNKPLPASAKPQTLNGRVYVPFASIFPQLGVQATWNNKTKVLSAQKPNFNLTLTLNASTAKLNGKSVKLDAPAKMINGRVYVPVRFVGTSLDAIIKTE